MLDRLLRSLEVSEGIAPAIVGIGIVRVDGDRLLVLLDRLLRPLEVTEGCAPKGISQAIIGCGRIFKAVFKSFNCIGKIIIFLRWVA